MFFFLTHELFVDDVMIFGKDVFDEWFHMRGITDLFCRSLGMTFSPHKSRFRHCGGEQNVLNNIMNLFSIQGGHLKSSISYLVFF